MHCVKRDQVVFPNTCVDMLAKRSKDRAYLAGLGQGAHDLTIIEGVPLKPFVHSHFGTNCFTILCGPRFPCRSHSTAAAAVAAGAQPHARADPTTCPLPTAARLRRRAHAHA